MHRVEPASAGAIGTAEATHDPSEAPAVAPRDQAAPFIAHPLPTALAALAVATLAFVSYPSLSRSLLAAFFAAVLVVLAVIDLERRCIPNLIVLPATAIVLVAHIAIEPTRTVELVLAPLVVGTFLLLPNLLNPAAIGMGDVKLALLLGAGLGWGAVGALLIGFITTLPFAVAILVRGGRSARNATLPLGPFLVFGGLFVLLAPGLT